MSWNRVHTSQQDHGPQGHRDRTPDNADVTQATTLTAQPDSPHDISPLPVAPVRIGGVQRRTSCRRPFGVMVNRTIGCSDSTPKTARFLFENWRADPWSVDTALSSSALTRTARISSAELSDLTKIGSGLWGIRTMTGD